MKNKTCKIKTIQKESVEVLKSSTQHSSVNEVFALNISEEDVEPQPNLSIQEIINLDHDDQPIWESAKTVALISTDISKITRKPSKTGKHGHGKRKSTREAKDSKPKPEKVKLQSKKAKP
ncbi:hypothetical protein Tco_1404839 [Tanacetum coccineum]